MQPPSLGHPASKRCTGTSQHLYPGVTSGSNPDSRTPQRDRAELPGHALEPHSASGLSAARPSTAIPLGMTCFPPFIHAWAPGPGTPGGKSSLRAQALPPTYSARTSAPSGATASLGWLWATAAGFGAIC